MGAEPQYRVNGRAWVPLKGCYKGTIKVPLQGITIRVLGVYTVSSFFVGSLKGFPVYQTKGSDYYQAHAGDLGGVKVLAQIRRA